jgi:hypothetical protein
MAKQQRGKKLVQFVKKGPLLNQRKPLTNYEKF